MIRSRPRLLALTAIGLFGLLLASAIGPSAAPGGPARPLAADVAPATALAGGLTGGFPLGPDFWGSDLRVFEHLGSYQARTFDRTPLHVVVWPGGAVGDEYNFTTNTVSLNARHHYAPPTSPPQFVAWCRNVGCVAIFQVPGEIDSPATAASYVAYVENDLHFRPAYWEIGNEPALWTHFGLPWSAWRNGQSSGITPTGYASLVHAYLAAMRAVDPSIQVLGLPGVGSGSAVETEWISATVRENGPELAGVAIHVYPAGAGAGSPDLSNFFSSLEGPGSLAARVGPDRQAIADACRRCGSLPLFVTELGEGTQGGVYDSDMVGFPNVPFVATELIDAMQLDLSNVDLYAYDGTYPGSLFHGGRESPTGTFYDDLLPLLGNWVLPLRIGSADAGVAAVATRDTRTGALTLFVANTDPTSRTFRLDMLGLPPGLTGEEWTWDGSAAAPTGAPLADGMPAEWTVPGVAVGLIRLVPPANVSVTGTVLSSRTGQPIAGARIWAENGDLTGAATSDAGGRFNLSLVPGDWNVSFAAEGFRPANVSLPVFAGQPITNLTLQEIPSSGCYAVTGNVLDLGQLLPIRGADVVATGSDGSAQTFTGPDGGFALEVPNGSYRLEASDPGYQSVNLDLLVNGSDVAGVVLGLSPAARPPTYDVAGRVIEGSAEPVGSAGVLVPGLPGVGNETGPAGDFDLPLPNGTFSLRVVSPGFHVASTNVTVAGTSVSVPDLLLVPSSVPVYRVSGLVTGPAGTGLGRNASLSIGTGTGVLTLETDPAGYFTTWLPNGSFPIRVSAPHQGTSVIVVDGAPVAGVEITLETVEEGPGLLSGGPAIALSLGLGIAGALFGTWLGLVFLRQIEILPLGIVWRRGPFPPRRRKR